MTLLCPQRWHTLKKGLASSWSLSRKFHSWFFTKVVKFIQAQHTWALNAVTAVHRSALRQREVHLAKVSKLHMPTERRRK